MKYRFTLALVLSLGCDAAQVPPEAAVEAEPDVPDCPDDCFRGHVHLDCGEDAQPELRCGADGAAEECLWVPQTCAVPGYAAPAAPIGQFVDPGWAWYTQYWGRAAWRRDTAMTLAVQVGEVASKSVTCTCIDGDQPTDLDCLGGNSICNPEASEVDVHTVVVEGWRPESGTLAWSIGGTFTYTGFSLVVEVDVPNLRARACLIGVSDTYMPRPDPQCADRGSVRLSALPGSADEIGTTQMHLRAEFDVVKLGNEDAPRHRDVVVEFAPDLADPILVPRH